MRFSIVPSQILLPQSSVKLGRFITNVEYPHQHHHDPQLEPTTLATARSAYTGEHHAASAAGIRSALTSLLSSSFSKGTKMKVCVATNHFKTYTLDNSEAWFDKATRLPATRSWIEQAIDQGHSIFLIVGFHTITDASIRQESMAGKRAGGHVQVPVSLSSAAVGAVAPLGGIVDPSVDFQRQGLDGEQSYFVAPGEQVCAIEYRKIRHAWLSSKHIDKSRLSDVRQWPTMERMRDEEDGEDDIVQVVLEDVDDLDGDWDKHVVEDETLFIPSFIRGN
ncbi:hypothetical protein QQS21_002008 [Conoideocrella luteorostrata]|uniref:Uncharacterized protein n=1 Tax=Conoideocrella luteorostrata TaxID=1105319 RepID=A0AAJ0FXS0_9HYPO|nr:hypothetical protein QQS21_002008 [Conoideocrella luteorostrata]